MKRIIKDYFTFSKKERIAIALLVTLMACFIAAPYLYHAAPRAPVDTPVLDAYVANASSNKRDSDSGADHGAAAFKHKDAALSAPSAAPAGTMPRKAESFPFDPNTITQEEWRRLGINEKTARTIINYRGKGGRFKKPDDIKKIWGIRREDADRLLPFVRIQTREMPVAVEKERALPKITVPKKIEPVDINAASEEEWKALPGIGEVLSKRIVTFRERIGGFSSIAQVSQTYGLVDSVFQKIMAYLRINAQTMPRWNINELSAYDLRRRLFLDATTARNIIYLRKKSGFFQSLEDLRKCGVSDTTFGRIVVFLKLE